MPDQRVYGDSTSFSSICCIEFPVNSGPVKVGDAGARFMTMTQRKRSWK